MKTLPATAIAAALCASAYANVVYVKFTDDLPQPRREAVMARVGGQWSRGHWIEDERLHELRAKATQRLGRPTADLTAEMRLTLPAFADEAAVLAMLNAMPEVEVAAVEAPEAPCLPPDYFPLPYAGYGRNPTAGVGAKTFWDLMGIRGQGVKVACIDGVFNQDHLDLPDVTIVGQTPEDPGWGTDHATAALGVVFAIDNGWGTTGIAPDAEPHFAGVYHGGQSQTAAAITASASIFGEGDVIFLEVGASVVPGAVPIEWNLSVYNAIVAAVGNGIVVVEPAGNASVSLADPDIAAGSANHFPFENDSGAIMVGAGAPPLSGWPDRSKLEFSNWGARVDVQGWGEKVMAPGYGTYYSAEGPDLWYTGTFAGTSSAGAHVAGAAAMLQSYFKATTGQPLDPIEARSLLIATGSPQMPGPFHPVSEHIGPRPNLVKAVFGTCDADLDGDGEVDAADLGVRVAAWGEAGPGDFDGSGSIDGADVGLLLAKAGLPCVD